MSYGVLPDVPPVSPVSVALMFSTQMLLRPFCAALVLVNSHATRRRVVVADTVTVVFVVL